MDPDSTLAVQVKKAFKDAQDLARKGKLRLIGGSVDLPELMENLIAFIDRRGTNIPIAASLDY